jgi:hypothetical protein
MTKKAITRSLKSQGQQGFPRRTLKGLQSCTPIVAVPFAACTLMFMLLPAGVVWGAWQPRGDLQGYGYEASRKSQSVLPPLPKDEFVPPGSAALGASPGAITAVRASAGAPEKPAASAMTTPQAAPLPTAKPRSNLAQACRQGRAAPPAPLSNGALSPAPTAPVQHLKPLAALVQVQPATQMAPTPNQATAPEEGPIVQPVPTQVQVQPATQMAPKAGP